MVEYTLVRGTTSLALTPANGSNTTSGIVTLSSTRT